MQASKVSAALETKENLKLSANKKGFVKKLFTSFIGKSLNRNDNANKTIYIRLNTIKPSSKTDDDWYITDDLDPKTVDENSYSTQFDLKSQNTTMDYEPYNDDSSLIDESDQQQSLNNLPLELVCKIISFLDLNDRKSASMVCKKWRYAFFESNCMHDVLVKANNVLFVSNRPSSNNNGKYQSSANLTSSTLTNSKHRAASSMALSSYSLTFNFYFYFNIINLEFENDSADVGLLINNLKIYKPNKSDANSRLLPKLKCLKFLKTSMSAKVLIDLLSETSNLESLLVEQCDSLFMSGFLTLNVSSINNSLPNLDNLKHLSLSKNRYLTDNIFNLFVNSTKRLETLDLSYCNITKNNYKSIQQTQIDLKSSSVVLTVENLVRVCSSQMLGKTLKSLNLTGVDLFNHDEDSLLSLADNLTQLGEISLANLQSIKVDTVAKLATKLNNLKSINLNNSMQDLNQRPVVETLFECLRDCQVVNMKKAMIRDPDVFKDQIVHLTQLTHLDLSCCSFERSFGAGDRLNEFIEYFAIDFSRLVNLQSLLLSFCDLIVTDRFVEIITKRLVNLTHLDLRNCSKITDKSVHYICTYLHKLTNLDLSWCQNISDYGLNNSVDNSKDKQLLNDLNKDLNLYLKKYVEQPFLLIKTRTQIANESKKLKEEKTDSTLNSNEWSDKKVVSLKNLAHLKVLKLESCINITDLGLFKGVNLTQLKELDIKLCTNVTGDFIYNSLGDVVNQQIKLFNNLRILNINQCTSFKQECLSFIVNNAPYLRELSVSSVPDVKNELIEQLIRMRKVLSVLDVSFCSNLNEPVVDNYEQFLYNEFGSREFVLDRRFISR